MARFIQYVFKGTTKQIPFSYDKYRDMYEAVAAAESIDLKQFFEMERQVTAIARQGAASKNYRQQAFKQFGFSDIKLLKDEDNSANS